MSILLIVTFIICMLAAVFFSTRCVLRSGTRHQLPKEIANELDPYNKLPS